MARYFVYQLFPVPNAYRDSSRVDVIESVVEVTGCGEIADQEIHI